MCRSPKSKASKRTVTSQFSIKVREIGEEEEEKRVEGVGGGGKQREFYPIVC
jgi:hypothetical protein